MPASQHQDDAKPVTRSPAEAPPAFAEARHVSAAKLSWRDFSRRTDGFRSRNTGDLLVAPNGFAYPMLAAPERWPLTQNLGAISIIGTFQISLISCIGICIFVTNL